MISSAYETTSQMQSLFAKMNTVYPYTNNTLTHKRQAWLSTPKKNPFKFNSWKLTHKEKKVF